VLCSHSYSKLYGPGEQYSWDDYGGWWFIPLNLVWFLIVTDFIIYWAHRWLHHPLVYVECQRLPAAAAAAVSCATRSAENRNKKMVSR